MRIFLAGASGVIGRPLLRGLLDAGHDVTAMTRSSQRAEGLRRTGAEAVVGDALDADGVTRLIADAHPEVVINEVSSIPRRLNPRKYGREMGPNDRVRIEGAKNIVDAAAAAGARRVVSQSFAVIYAPVGPGPKDEDAALYLDSPFPLRRTIEALAFLEQETLGTKGLEGVALRYGFFYGPGTTYAHDGDVAARVRKRRLPVVGAGTGEFSFIELGDAVSATIAALAGPTGVFNVVDDHPAQVREWLPFYAAVVGAKPPRTVPRWLVRVLAGEFAAYSMTQTRGASNARIKRELGWAPRYASWRKGFQEALG
jgi:nucleoside-diphosphate-sugar epimerase